MPSHIAPSRSPPPCAAAAAAAPRCPQLKDRATVESYKPGQQLDVSELLKEGEAVDVAGLTVGKGFQGERAPGVGCWDEGVCHQGEGPPGWGPSGGMSSQEGAAAGPAARGLMDAAAAAAALAEGAAGPTGLCAIAIRHERYEMVRQQQWQQQRGSLLGRALIHSSSSSGGGSSSSSGNSKRCRTTPHPVGRRAGHTAQAEVQAPWWSGRPGCERQRQQQQQMERVSAWPGQKGR